jgi:hypothetical protein
MCYLCGEAGRPRPFYFLGGDCSLNRGVYVFGRVCN